MSDRVTTLSRVLKTAAVNISASGDNTVQAIPAGKVFKIYGMFLQGGGAVDLIIKSGSTAITGAITFDMGGEISIFDEKPILCGVALGEDIVFNLSGAVDMDGWLQYTEADL